MNPAEMSVAGKKERRLLEEESEMNSAEMSVVGEREHRLLEGILGGNLGLVRSAIDSGAKVNFIYPESYTDDVNLIDIQVDRNLINTCVQSGLNSLGIAVLMKRLDIVQKLIDAGANPNFQDPKGNSALFLSVQTGQVEVTDYLLKSNADYSVQNNSGCTPVHQAFQSKHFELVKLFIRFMPEDRIDIENCNQETLLHYAALNGDENIDIVQMLLQRNASVNKCSKNSLSPLHIAAHSGYGSENVVRELLDNGASVSLADKHGKTPLHIAVESQCLAVVKLLVQYGADVNAVDHDGQSALHIASKCGEEFGSLDLTDSIPHSIQYLIKCGINQSLRDKNGLTALHCLSKNDICNIENFKMLCTDENVNATDKYGRTALHYSAFLGFTQNILALLSSKHVNVHVQDDRGWTPLHCAIAFGSEEIVIRLLSAVCDLKAVDFIGRSVLHLSAMYGHTALIDHFIEEGLDQNRVDKEGRTCLHYAALYRQDEAVRILLEKGANPEEKDKMGLAPADYLHPCESLSQTYNLLRGRGLQTQVFSLKDDDSFSPSSSIPITAGLSELHGKSGLGAVSNIEGFNMDGFISHLRMELLGIIKEVIPELKRWKFTEIKASDENVSHRDSVDWMAYGRCDSHLIGCGSTFEGTKVGTPNEFDFLVQLYYLGKSGETTDDGYQCMFLHVGKNDVRYRHDKLNIEHSFCTWLWSKLLVYWSENVTLQVAKGEGQFFMPLPPERFPDRTSCVTWVWMYSDPTFKMLPVSIDLVPSLAVGRKRPDYCRNWPDWLNEKTDSEFGYMYYAHLVPKIPNSFCGISRSFGKPEMLKLGRLSFPTAEVRFFMTLDTRVKQVYITAKVLRMPEVCGFKVKNVNGELSPVSDFVTSYRLKTVFLHLVKMFQETRLSLGRMVLYVYEKLEECLEQEYLPVFFLPSMNVLTGSKLSTGDSLKVVKIMTKLVRYLYKRDFSPDLENDIVEEGKETFLDLMPVFKPE